MAVTPLSTPLTASSSCCAVFTRHLPLPLPRKTAFLSSPSSSLVLGGSRLAGLIFKKRTLSGDVGFGGVKCMTSAAPSVLPKALLFDCDGVLVDTEKDGHRLSFNETFAEKQLRFSQWAVLMAMRSVITRSGVRGLMEGGKRTWALGPRYSSESKGRILSEEERAQETVYIQKMEREKAEKLKKKKAELEKAQEEKAGKKAEEQTQKS